MNDVAASQAPPAAPPSAPADAVVADLWARRLEWSAAADNLKRKTVLARGVALFLSSLGAILAAVAASFLAHKPELRTPCAAASAILLGFATYITRWFLTPEAIRAWTRARSVSEALEAEIFTFRAGAAPYGGANAIDLLFNKSQAIQATATDLKGNLVGVQAKSSTPPPGLDRDKYITQRVQHEINSYYLTNALLNAARLSRFRTLEFLLGLAATVLGGLASYFSSLDSSLHSLFSTWVPVFTTLSAAVASHLAASRYAFLVMSYEGTAQRLQDLMTWWRSRQPPTDTDWSQFVKSAEEAMAIENESWTAKWAEKIDGAKQ
jgi:hypothetical protein